MLNYVFLTYKKQDKHKKAYEAGVRAELLDDLRFIISESLLEWVLPSDLTDVFNYLLAETKFTENLLTKQSDSGKSIQQVRNENITNLVNGIKNARLSPVENYWKTVEIVWNHYSQSNAKPDRGRITDKQTQAVLDLLVRKFF